MVKEKRDVLVLSLVIVVVLLLVFLGYLFIVSPALNGLVTKGYNQGIQNAVISIAQQVATCPTQGVPLNVGNTTINLVAMECYQQPSQESQ